MTIEQLEKSIYEHSERVNQFVLQEEIKNDDCRYSLLMVNGYESLMIMALERALTNVVTELSGIMNWINENPDIKKRFDAVELLCPNYEEVEKYIEQIKKEES